MANMPYSSTNGQPDPDAEEVILGVDTHQDVHVAALITALGVQVADATFPTTTAGYRQLLAWARTFGALRRSRPSRPVPLLIQMAGVRESRAPPGLRGREPMVMKQ